MATDSRMMKTVEERRHAFDTCQPTYGAVSPAQVFSGDNPQINGPTEGVVVALPYLPEKSLCDAYLLCVPFGLLGFHHFYLRRYWFGFIYFFTGGLLGVGWVADLIRLPWLVRDANLKMSRSPGEEDIPQVDLVDTYLLWFPFGILGLHHFYLRRPIWGIAYFLSGGVFGIGWIVDAFRIPSLVRKTNERLLLEHIQREETPEYFRVSLCDAYVMCLVPPLGILGVHHFYLRRYATGLFYFFTGGGFAIGWIVDWFRLKWLVERTNHPERFPLGRRQKFLDDAYVYAFPMGLLGVHHFYLERPVWGFLYLFTGGLFGFGWLIDLCRMPCLVDGANRRIGHELALRAAASAAHRQHLPHEGTATQVIYTSQDRSTSTTSQGNLVTGTASYVGAPTNYNPRWDTRDFYPPPYQHSVDHPPHGNTSWMSVAPQPPSSLPGGLSTSPPAYGQ